ncbi:hypothetical protein ASZ90_016981 [hydrocarbon metagenome]|uniref:Uncharacterized protein n=1 Tax=hydrocarbon metagenome TaxID=938273 RepID=A0A0W8EAW2_9ZZZZ
MSPAAWKRIGKLEKYFQGVRVTFRDPFGEDHTLHLSREDVQKITRDRMPGDLLRVEDNDTGQGGDVTISTEGRAYRSRSGKALCITHPCLAGGSAMCPWKSFLAVLEGSQQAAPLSIMEQGKPSPQAHGSTATSIREGLAGGF